MTGSEPSALGRLLEAVAAIGPYFAVTVGAAPADARPLADLHGTRAGERSPVVAEGIARMAARLGGCEPRVAASTLHLGVASRLWSVSLGAAVLGGVVPDLDPDAACFRLPDSGPIELWLPEPARLSVGDGPSGDLPRLAGILYRGVAERHLEPFGRAVRAVTPIAPRLLWGNASAALAGAAGVLYMHLTPSRPEAARTAKSLAALLTEHGELRGTGHWHPALETPVWRRHSCCLYYRTPRGGLCGGCPLPVDPFRRRRSGESETTP